MKVESNRVMWILIFDLCNKYGRVLFLIVYVNKIVIGCSLEGEVRMLNLLSYYRGSILFFNFFIWLWKIYGYRKVCIDYIYIWNVKFEILGNNNSKDW